METEPASDRIHLLISSSPSEMVYTESYNNLIFAKVVPRASMASIITSRREGTLSETPLGVCCARWSIFFVNSGSISVLLLRLHALGG